MNKKTIKAVLSKKINQWLDSIEDTEIRSLARNNTIVTGGAIVSLLTGEDVKDFDLYFQTKEATLKIAKYYVDRFKKEHADTGAYIEEIDGRIKICIPGKGVASENEEQLAEQFEDVFDVLPGEDKKTSFRPIFLSSNAITLANKVQLVIRFYGDADEIQKNYDFVHCTSYWTSKDNKLVLRPEALEAILAKELIYVGSKYPLCSVIRTRKFIKRGWHINAGQYLKMMFQISQLNLTDLKVLEDQLVGVDSSYFSQMIDGLVSKQESNPSFKLSDSYLAEVVNRIFN